MLFTLVLLCSLLPASPRVTATPGLSPRSSSPCATESHIPSFNCIDFTPPDGNPTAVHINSAVIPSSTDTIAADAVPSGAPWGSTNNPTDMCDDDTFVDLTGWDPSGATLCKDCATIESYMRMHNGRFQINDRLQQIQEWTPLMYGGGCAFMVTSPGKPSAQGYYVGNTNVADLINIGIRVRGRQGVLQANGSMHCTNGKDKVPVKFWILHKNGTSG
ncbi:uncharacterized protein BCR38DRAFT_404149 [Pseudomassariella vexata]|uniref:Ecp2 effector protein-like domain-containing protein n=1 Tax=Pseudomassariella vexata TaxID=1141098 RepID=A0A1Y2EHI2_9PEZI|nr:uncharacterized protein BCR38DRAFT_404149 [Pseudomassariella vexata]ORY71023.1 hypothetical protein BCR38DRAFT_404149 [Pseudomassariella vexata]